MYLEIFPADFAVFRVFWGISRKYLNFAGPRPREISEALIRGVTFGLPCLPLAAALLFSGKHVIGLSYFAFFILSSEWTGAN